MMIFEDEHLIGEGTLTDESVQEDWFDVRYSIFVFHSVNGFDMKPGPPETPRLPPQFYQVEFVTSKDGRGLRDGNYLLVERAIVVSKHIRLVKRKDQWKVVPPVLSVSNAPRDPDE